MANKMLIDASHPEETRVVVLRGNRIEDFDFEAANKKPLRGNIYLAKVTRVEPSLQAAFIEYGGNRHGFLAFSEIHPDYYQIPVADRQALLDEENRQQSDDEEEDTRGERGRRSRRHRRGRGDRSDKRAANGDQTISSEAAADGDEAHLSPLSPPAEQPDAEFLPAGDHVSEAGEPQDQAAQAHESDEPHASEPHADAPAAGHAPVEAAAEQPKEAAPQADEPREAVRAIEGSVASPPEPVTLLGDAAHAPAEPVSVDQGAASDDQGATEDALPVDADHQEATARFAAGHNEGEMAAEAEEADSDEDDDDEAGEDGEEEEHVEMLGGDAMEEMPRRMPRGRRQYKIQEVIRRRQVLLVQVVKEERGNKGAALTTYLSLAGRYSVLMPNTARGGGISRKITDSDDRRRLKEIAQELDVPDGMGVILRTAGASRTKQEVRRDFEYLLRMWESVRELTLQSTAPSLVYEEGSLIKRSIRDLFNKDIDDITVAGEEGFEEARSFMGMLMPSHVRNVKMWREQQPLFAKFGVEQQLDGMFSTQVTLKSGGYIVINQTEALVAIDVNSGRSTREHNIEDTALRTNVEAADEVARQLRLRDLAGLIVVDFIDMEEHRNNRTVERRLKEALRADRARIQVGRISHFGLLEMSRQRMRPGVLEGSSVICPHCAGAGTVRSTSSIALHVLRVLEDTLIRNAAFNMTVKTRSVVALYILNQKRAHLRELEERFGVAITVLADDSLTGSTYHAFERGEPATPVPGIQRALVRVDSISPYDSESPDDAEDGEEENDAETDNDGEELSESAGAENPAENGGAHDGNGNDGNRRRRRRRRGRNRESTGIEQDAPQPADDALAAVASINGEAALHGDADTAGESEGDDDQSADGDTVSGEGQRDGRGKRRRSRRGNRRGPYGMQRGEEADERGATPGSWIKTDDGQPDAEFAPFSAAAETSLEAEAREATHAPEPDSQHERPAEPEAMEAHAEETHVASPPPAAEPKAIEPKPAEPKPAEPKAAEPQAAEPAPAAPAPEPVHREVEVLPEAPPPQQKRGGWWQRAKSTLSGA
ncbi:Rne/Rng family ribonuclease [Roseiarcaceae bacterium H3SJ34-1]|uniref:Rne/Rng family ribonuclease n=1 Tax=Terripilifer ovatus TaxID=3032367 RepID=UPI003AB979E5|nr:Rne/Rng family ribonuclease [Roseiarcaceae bacterium H3SJ34-1]